MRSKPKVFLLVMLMAMAVAAPAWAADEPAKAGKSMSMVDTIIAGGMIGHTIILLSVVSMTMVITSAMAMKRDALVPPDLLAQVESYFDDEEYEDAMTLCEANPSFLAKVLQAGLPKVSQGWGEVKAAMEAAADAEATKLTQQLSYLTLIGSTAPMLGLLGTVVGMILAFNQLAASGGQADAAALASSIGMALVTTAEGIIVAVPTNTAYFILRNILGKAVIEIGAVSEELMERFQYQEE